MKTMNKISTFLFVLTGTIVLALFNVQTGLAQAPSLETEFENTPLFEEANFLPGQEVSRWARVTNNTSQSQRIAIEAINTSDPDRLGDVLKIETKQGGSLLYANSLSSFFNAGEVYLSDISANQTLQYDFVVSFFKGANNTFQGKTLSFDILLGFQGTEGGILPGAGGGGGGYLPPGLTIKDETATATNITATSVTIKWTTNYLATSQVIFSPETSPHILDLTDRFGTPPAYGYAFTTPEYDTDPRVTEHVVTIYGLNLGTTYYYRCVSHASPPTISREHAFTTLGAKITTEQEKEEELIEGEPQEQEEKIVSLDKEAKTALKTEEEKIVPEKQGEIPSLSQKDSFPQKVPVSGVKPSLLASLSALFKKLSQPLFLIILLGVCLAILIFLKLIPGKNKVS